jgi:DNA-binding winged helix-turn-helix (wHTH) protein
MLTPASTNRVWRFGVYEVDTRRLELRRGGMPVKMREQSFLILIHLLEHAGEIVSREELRRILWHSDTFVDFEHSLNMAVMNLRDALHDSIEAPLYIETVPKHGYRFIAPVTQAADARDKAANSTSEFSWPSINGSNGALHAAPAPAETPDRRRRFGFSGAVIVLIVLAGVGSIVFMRMRHDPAWPADGNQVSSPFRIVPGTTAPGRAISPAISPDGREVAFLWDGPAQGSFDLYVQLLGSVIPLRIAENRGGALGAPAWSPGGEEIAFIRCDGKNDGVFVVPALGGSERELAHVGCRFERAGQVAWLPDGKGILMLDDCSPQGQPGLVLFSLKTGEKHCLVQSGPPNDFYDLFQPGTSPLPRR